MAKNKLKTRNTELEFIESGNCFLCGKNTHKNSLLIPLQSLKFRLFLYVQKAVETIASSESLELKSICKFHLQKILDDRIDDLLEEDLYQLYKLQEEGIKVLGQYEVEEDTWLQRFEREGTMGQKAADAVARVGGSWTFLISLITGIFIWMILNGLILTATSTGPFDPFPFILLNLFLSCLAALQAPIIMMSQNRQDEKDREVNQFVSKVILRNEHQTRHVNAKMDHLLSFQWKRLLEIQEIQTVLLQIQRKQNKSAIKSQKLYMSQQRQYSNFFSVELIPDNFTRLLLRHALEIDKADDTLIFSHWHEEGDNFTGIIDNVSPKFTKLKLTGLDFDIFFNHHPASLDDIISGDNRLVLRNDFHLTHMNLVGQIIKMQLFVKNQMSSYNCRELPQRYKPAYALKRLDRISDFWKTPHNRIRMTYETPQQFGILHLSPTEYFKDGTVTFFFGQTEKTDACLYVMKLDYIPEDNEFDSATLIDILQSLISLDSKSSKMIKIAEINEFKCIDGQSTSVIPMSELSGSGTFIFITSDIKATIHGVIGLRDWDKLEDSSNIFNIDDRDPEEHALLADQGNDDF